MSKFLKAFTQFGVEFTGDDGGNNTFGQCPFSGKENKFYVNTENGLWDSKVTGQRGNLVTFCRQFYDELANNTDAIDLKEVAKKKQLPTYILLDYMAFNPLTGRFAIPYKNPLGEIVNIGHYDVSSNRLMKTGTLSQTLLGLDELATSDSSTVFICEGEWDFFAMKWLVKRNNLQHAVVGLSSANVFKEDWVEHFQGKEIFCVLDNDEAGRNGTDRVKNMLHAGAHSMKFINWGDKPDKYDIKDYIVDYVGDLTSFRTSHKSCMESILKMMHSDTPNELTGVIKPVTAPTTQVVIPQPEELDEVFKKWFKIRDNDIALDVLLGTCFANKLKGDPVWMYFVGSPGSRKTAMLMSLNKSSFVETVSSVTPASLISGMRATGSEDPSLIPKLNNRMLVIKDVTTILSGASFVRDEIFGILRDAYDGYIEKVWGNGLKKSFKSKFGIIGAVTPVIDGYQSAQAILGERFLKVRLEPNIKMENEFDIIDRTLNNIDKETGMNDEMQNVVHRMLEKPLPESRLEFSSKELRTRIIYIGMFVAKMRGSININVYTKEQQSLPIQEIATRVTKQLSKLAMGIAIFRNHTSIGDYEIEICRRVALDTCPDRVEMLVRFINSKKGEPVFTKDLIEFTNLSSATISKMCESLTALRIISRVKGQERIASAYVLGKNIKHLVEVSNIYDPLEVVPDVTDSIRVRTGEKKRATSKVKIKSPIISPEKRRIKIRAKK